MMINSNQQERCPGASQLPHRALPEVVKVRVQADVPLLRRLERILALPQLRCEAINLRFQRLPCPLCFFPPLHGASWLAPP